MEHGLVFLVGEADVLEHEMPFDARHGTRTPWIVVLRRPGQEFRGPVETGECLGHLGSDVGHLHNGPNQKSHENRELEKIPQRQ